MAAALRRRAAQQCRPAAVVHAATTTTGPAGARRWCRRRHPPVCQSRHCVAHVNPCRRGAVAVASSAAGAVPAPGEPTAGDEPKASYTATVLSLVNVIMGAGAVSIPFALRQGGWATLAVLWLLGAVFCWTGKLVLQLCARVDATNQQQAQAVAKQQQQQQEPPGSLSQELQPADAPPPPPPAGYEAVAEAAFGRVGRLAVSGMMYAELLGLCCVYLVLEAETLAGLLQHTPLGAALARQLGPSCWVLTASVLIVPTVLLPGLEALAALGALGVLAAAAVGAALAGLFCSTPAALTGVADTCLLRPSTLPSVLGILAFVYAGHSTFPVIQRSMAQPSRGQAAVTAGYAITAGICTLIGVFGFAMFASRTAEVVTANLPPGTLLAVAVTALTLVNPFSAFAVTLEPVAVAVQQAVTTKTGSSGQPPYVVRAAIRLGLALALCVLAASLPYVADLMSLVGALLTMSISLILPALMHMRLAGPLPPMLLLLDGCVLLLGLACAAVGSSSAAASLQAKVAAAAAATAAV